MKRDTKSKYNILTLLVLTAIVAMYLCYFMFAPYVAEKIIYRIYLCILTAGMFFCGIKTKFVEFIHNSDIHPIAVVLMTSVAFISFFLRLIAEIWGQIGPLFAIISALFLLAWCFVFTYFEAFTLDLLACVNHKSEKKFRRDTGYQDIRGMLTYDNFDCYRAAQNLDKVEYRSDIHSFAYLVLLRMLGMMCGSNYFWITIFFVISFSFAWSFCMTTLNRAGLSGVFCYLFTVVWLLFPSNVLMLCTSWKDIPFTICLLLACTYIFRFLHGEDRNDNISSSWGIGITLLTMSLFRSNGFVILLVICALFLAFRLSNRISNKMLLPVLAASIIAVIYKGPFLDAVKVDRGPDSFAAYPFLDAVWENIHAGNQMDSWIIDYVNELMPYEKFEESYLGYKFNDDSFGGYFNENLDLDKSVRAYIWCLRNYPITTISARAKRTYNLWAYFPSSTYPVTYNYVRDLNDFTGLYNWEYLQRYSSERESLANACAEWDISSLLNRASVCMVVWIGVILSLFQKKKHTYICVIFPAVINLLTLLTACCFPDYRYSYPIFVATVPFVCLALI